MKTNIIVYISPPISYLAKFCFSSYGPKCCWIIKEVCISLQYLQKNSRNKVDFLPADKHKGFPQIDSITSQAFAKNSK